MLSALACTNQRRQRPKSERPPRSTEYRWAKVTPHDRRGDQDAELGHSARLRWKARFERIRAMWTAATDRARSVVPALDLLWRVGSQYRRLNGSVLVGHLTYRFFLWFAPFLVVLVALLGYGAAAQVSVAKYLGEVGLDEAFTTSVSEQAQSSRLQLLVFGSFALLYTTWGLLRGMHHVYAQCGRQRSDRHEASPEPSVSCSWVRW